MYAMSQNVTSGDIWANCSFFVMPRLDELVVVVAVDLLGLGARSFDGDLLDDLPRERDLRRGVVGGSFGIEVPLNEASAGRSDAEGSPHIAMLRPLVVMACPSSVSSGSFSAP